MRCESSHPGGGVLVAVEPRTGGWVTSAHTVITVQVIFRRAPLNNHLTLRHDYSSLKQPEVNVNQKRFKAHLSPEFFSLFIVLLPKLFCDSDY